MVPIEAILSKIELGTLLPNSLFVAIDFNAALAERDQPAFENRWLSASKNLETLWNQRPALSAEAALIQRVREMAFKRAFDASSGHHDLAAQISDDFDLICRKHLLKLDDPFIDEIERSYLAHRFPTSKD